MEIHFQTTDHVVAVEIVAEQHIGTKLCSCNTFEDISHLLIIRQKFITHSKVGQVACSTSLLSSQRDVIASFSLSKPIRPLVD